MAVFKASGKGDLHRIRGMITLEYENEEMARAIYESIDVDNYQFLDCTVKGNKLICETRAEKASKLLHTLDDLLACIIVAEEVYRTS